MSHPSRRSIAVRGLVQGVGFRPYVWRLARRHGLTGFVRNDRAGVTIEVEGDREALERFTGAITVQPPPRARIASLEWFSAPARGEREFRIAQSEDSAATGDAPDIGADVATCDACLAEILDPRDRRHAHAFASCTDCGPRYTLATSAPYDRARTTMADFPMCARCRAEYENPSDRRFHAQPIACPDCGPRLTALDIQAAAAALRAGRIVAIKGLGGFHLACDAASDAAVARLRARKRRDAKPFAIMVADLEAAGAIAPLTAAECALLASPASPIVLVRARPLAPVSTLVAPKLARVGLMLPSTPLHHLLLRAFGGALVMTSGNASDEPMAIEDTDARERLAGIADDFLTHDRPITARCDDSVARIADAPAAGTIWLRRSRGLAPSAEMLPLPLAQPTLATGGHLKSVFALGERCRAIPSHHLGDLEHPAAFDAYVAAVAQYEALFGITPARIVHDLHPNYATSQWARERAAAVGVSLMPVQHHHAHIASCIAENGLQEAVIGIAFDGNGYGPDGCVWGGEFLRATCAGYERMAHLRNVPLPGGDAAAREPWRMALAHALDANLDPAVLLARLSIEPSQARTVLRMLERGVNAPLTSSIGRLFDAVAAIAGLVARSAFEAQAAQQLEGLAEGAAPEPGYPFALGNGVGGLLELDPRPMIAAASADAAARLSPARIARRFHEGLALALAQLCAALRERSGLNRVALSGGVFCNALLTSLATRALVARGFEVFRQTRLPPNDGGLAYGQLAIAAARDAAAAAGAR